MAQPTSPDREKLVCKECGYENEAERVYCHNCGVKLDRAVLPTTGDKVQPSPKRRSDTIRRVRKVQTGAEGAGKSFFGALFKSLAFGFLLACAIQSFRAPDGLPAPSDGSVESPFIQFDMDDALLAPGRRRLTYTEPQVNAYLKTTLKAKQGTTKVGTQLRFNRAFVKLSKADGGTVDFGVEHGLFGHPFYMSQRYVTSLKDGQVSAELTRGSVGRLTFPPVIARGYDWLFAKFWKALDRELKLFKRMESITVGDGTVDIISKPGAPVRAAS